MALPTYNVEEPPSPLKLNEQRNLFKLFQNDVGLLSLQYSSGGIQLRILQGDALSNVLGVPNYRIRKALVLCNDNLHIDGAIEYAPVYMTMFITRHGDAKDLICKVDLTGLSTGRPLA